MKILKTIFIISMVLGIRLIITYVETLSGVSAVIYAIPNLFIGLAIGIYSICLIIDIWET
jgi:hypothetical protein